MNHDSKRRQDKVSAAKVSPRGARRDRGKFAPFLWDSKRKAV